MNYFGKVTVKNSGGDGMFVSGSGNHFAEVEIENTKGTGLTVDTSNSVMQKLGLPADTNAAELADLLIKLRATPDSEKGAAVKQSNIFKRWASAGMDVSTLFANMLTISQGLPASFAAVMSMLGK